MKNAGAWSVVITVAMLFASTAALASDQIPKAAWKRAIGLPLENPGKEKASIPYPHIDDGYWQGAPVGGFGAGTFSRSYRGDFSRWHIKAGVHKYQSVWANQFSVYQRPEGGEAVAQTLYAGQPEGQALSSWKWNYPVGAGDYHALYPKSWYDYRWQQFPARIVLEQFSPILPNNYKETSYPVALYNWHASNPSNQRVTVSILFTWTNMVGWFRDFSQSLSAQINQGNVNRSRSEALSAAGRSATMKGIVFDRARLAPVSEEWDGQFAIAALETPGVEVTYHTTFSPGSDGVEIWQPFAATGKLSNSRNSWTSSDEQLAGAIAVTFTLAPGEKKTVPMVLAWDLPAVEFGHGRKWWRRYTEFFGTSGTNAWAIARTALASGDQWSAAIDQWQAQYVNDESKPLWYRGMLFNEMYVVGDNGTVWARPANAPPASPYYFTFLECFDYLFYGTLDVRFYGSMPLAKFWPEIDKQEIRQFADTVVRDWPEKMLWVWKSVQENKQFFRTRKAPGAVPHDLGHPQEDPFFNPNQFSWQDTNGWKDLNSKFVLMVYRDYVFSGSTDAAFLRYTWPAVRQALTYLRKYDRNGDGLPENDGYPDQTYDVWVVKGESAYCGSLYLAALRAAEEIAKKLGQPAAAREYRALFDRAQKSFVSKLWNGEYFRYDTESEYRDNVMADQLAGQWYANMTGLGDIVPVEMRRSALKKIFDLNVLKFGNGEIGAANGIGADGSIIRTNEQVHEVWTGTTFGLAAFMLSEGMRDEGYRTAWGIYNVVYDKYGYWFRTPEAWDETGAFRASMYMRPAAIWAMEMTEPPGKSTAAATK